MIDFDLNNMTPRKILKHLKDNMVPLAALPNINATEKTYGKRQAVLDVLKEYQIWLAELANPEEEQIEE